MPRIAFTVLLCAMGAATAAALMTRRESPRQVAEAAAIVASERTAAEPPIIPPPPSLPAQAASIPSLTFVVETTRSGPDGTSRTAQTVTRSRDRVRVALEGARLEWLFSQNVVYRDRAVAYRTDHDHGEVHLYEESALRSVTGIRGWMDVLTLRFDRSVLAKLRDTGERRIIGETTFTRYVARDLPAGVVQEVWWSDELLLPLSVTIRRSRTTTTSIVKGLAYTADAAVLMDPMSRFPNYKVLDPSDASDHH
jgi:hypothetical protein